MRLLRLDACSCNKPLFLLPYYTKIYLQIKEYVHEIATRKKPIFYRAYPTFLECSCDVFLLRR
jgi:hypothetical protein